jgi:hypothetical protein
MNEEFIASFIQGGKKKPKKFKHWVKMPQPLFSDALEVKAIDPERYYIDGVAFFQFDGVTAIVNFVNLYDAEDFYSKITNYLIVQAMGENPVQRGGIFF